MQKINVIDAQGKKSGSVEIAFTPSSEYAWKAYSVSIRRLLQNWRQGTVGSKSRGEVALSNRKPFKQKGTGRARAGTFRSPLWRKGGVIFGPQARVAKVNISRKQKRLALASAVSGAMLNDRLKTVDFEVSSDMPSTKQARTLLKGLSMSNNKVVLFLSGDDSKHYLSFRNMPNVNIVFYDQPNAFDLTDGNSWLVLKKDVELFNQMVAKWN